jgi:DNA-binding XRE family transcriptional regulator
MAMAHDTKKKLALHLGTTLREARKRAALTQADVAGSVGLVTEVFGRMERGNVLPSVPTLRKICLALRLDANTLLGLDTYKSLPWLESAPEEADSREMRRLLRALRRMNAAQLVVVSSTVHALARYSESLGHGDSK